MQNIRYVLATHAEVDADFAIHFVDIKGESAVAAFLNADLDLPTVTPGRNGVECWLYGET